MSTAACVRPLQQSTQLTRRLPCMHHVRNIFEQPAQINGTMGAVWVGTAQPARRAATMQPAGQSAAHVAAKQHAACHLPCLACTLRFTCTPVSHLDKSMDRGVGGGGKCNRQQQQHQQQHATCSRLQQRQHAALPCTHCAREFFHPLARINGINGAVARRQEAAAGGAGAVRSSSGSRCR